MTLVIMAAGMGSRFGGLKQIEPINDEGDFIIDYSIYDAIQVGFTKVVFIIKKENYEIFRDTVGKRIENKIKVEYVFQDVKDLPNGYTCPKDREKPWGTGHAILCAKDKVNEPFAIVNADDFYGKDAFVTISKFLKNINEYKDKLPCAIVGYHLINTVTENGSVKRGVLIEENGKLVELIESKIEKENGKFMAYPLEKEEPFEVLPNTLVSMNMLAFTPEIFDYLEKGFKEFLDNNIDNLKSEFLIPSYVNELMNKGIMDVHVLNTTAKWLGMTYKEDLESVKNEIKLLHESKIYPEKLWN